MPQDFDRVMDRVRSDCDGKKGYPSAQFAGKVAARRRRLGAPRLRAYECPWCGKWHLTKTRA